MITELINQYEKILEKPKSDDRFYHIKSVANFINNFSQLKDTSKIKANNILNEYLNYAFENSIENIEDGVFIFNTYIKPLGEIYKSDCNFLHYIKTWLVAFYCIIGAAVFSLLFKNYYWLVVIISFLTFMFITVYIKRKQALGKVFDIFY